jgi:glycosyltransferase involved in cell wall biosynthesis
MRVSIITPVYNAEKFIARCIRSVLAQTYTDWEMLIVDDGSTDRTSSIIREFDDARITYVPLPHRGIASLGETYNTALARASGELVAILEGDDEWPANKLALQVPAFLEDDVVLSWGRGMIIDEDDRPSGYWPVKRQFRRDIPMNELFRVLARWNVLSPAVTVMIRKAALQAIGGFQMAGSRLFVDLPTWLRIAATADGRARYINGDLGLYRIHTSNTGLVHNSRMRLEHDTVFNAIKTEVGPERLRELDWTRADERRTEGSAALTRGIAALQDGDRDSARAAFGAALKSARSAPEFARALAGYTSAVTGVDLISTVIGLRYGQARRMLRFFRS